MDAGRLHSEEAGLEEGLGAPEPLVPDGDDLSVGELVALLQAGAGGRGLHLLLEVQGHVAQLLLDVADDLALGGGGERVAALGEDLHQVVGQVATGQIQTKDGVGESVTLVDGHGVRNTVTGVEHDTGGTSGGVQGEHGLDGDVHGGGVEGLEHDLRHLLPVGLGVEGGLGQQNWVLLGGHTQLVVEGVVPDLQGVDGNEVKTLLAPGYRGFLTFSMSSQLVTMPCSIGYFRVRIPLLLWASSPTYESF